MPCVWTGIPEVGGRGPAWMPSAAGVGPVWGGSIGAGSRDPVCVGRPLGRSPAKQRRLPTSVALMTGRGVASTGRGRCFTHLSWDSVLLGCT